MRFSDSFLDDIRDRVPISAVIGERVTWDRKKTNAGKGDWWACCPFHGEKSPSFHCEDRKGRYHCFGCGVSGDHFRFLTELGGLSFPEAVERVADMAGVPLPARDEIQEKRERERSSLTDVMEMATAFFEQQLQGAAGAKARAYLRERGLSARTQQTFRLGYSPDSRNALKEHLAAKGVAKDQIEACGLVVHGPDIAVSYDRFRDRVMFPIPDSRGRIIAFGGRALSPDAPAKYLNSNETELFHKGNVLYNFARARQALGREGTLIAVEGYMDVIALAQAGIETVVAPLGTALTENQLELLWRMNGEPVLCFDGDGAGIRAAQRAADLALPLVTAGKSLRFAILPEGKDPDDLVREAGAQAFREVLDQARPLADMIWMRETAGGVFDTPEKRADLERRLREATSRIKDESVRFHYAQEMRERALAFFGQVRGGGNAARRRFEGGRGEKGSQQAGTRGRIALSDGLQRSALVKGSSSAMSLREATILSAVVNHPTLLDENFEIVERLGLAGADARRLHGAIIDAAAHGAHDRGAIVETIRRHGLDDVWERTEMLVRRARMWPATEEASINDARDAFLQALHLQQAAHNLHRELKAAETALAADPTEENYRHLVDIQAQLRGMQAGEALIDGFGVESGRVMRN